jgi:hypothetical protein
MIYTPKADRSEQRSIGLGTPFPPRPGRPRARDAPPDLEVP